MTPTLSTHRHVDLGAARVERMARKLRLRRRTKRPAGTARR